MIQSYKDLQVFRLSYELAMEVFQLTKKFPKEELYSLTDQVRRSSRSVTANIVDGWSKRRYESAVRKLEDAYRGEKIMIQETGSKKREARGKRRARGKQVLLLASGLLPLASRSDA